MAFEHQRNQGRNNVRSVQENTVKEETPRPMWVHPLCGKTHKKGECSYVCKGCKMIGSHKPEVCWKLHPQLKPEHMKRKDERYRYRERSRSREGGEGSKRGREKSPHPNRNVRRITSGDRQETNRDSDDSHDTLDQIKEAEKEAKRYKELADRAEEVARIKKKSLKQRRLKRTSKTSRSRSPEGNSGTGTRQSQTKYFQQMWRKYSCMN